MIHKRLRLYQVFAMPLVLGGLSLAGLVLALFVDGPADWIGAGLLATTIAAILKARARAHRR